VIESDSHLRGAPASVHGSNAGTEAWDHDRVDALVGRGSIVVRDGEQSGAECQIWVQRVSNAFWNAHGWGDNEEWLAVMRSVGKISADPTGSSP
jgi:hypothetical protein